MLWFTTGPWTICIQAVEAMSECACTHPYLHRLHLHKRWAHSPTACSNGAAHVHACKSLTWNHPLSPSVCKVKRLGNSLLAYKDILLRLHQKLCLLNLKVANCSITQRIMLLNISLYRQFLWGNFENGKWKWLLFCANILQNSRTEKHMEIHIQTLRSNYKDWFFCNYNCNYKYIASE